MSVAVAGGRWARTRQRIGVLPDMFRLALLARNPIEAYGYLRRNQAPEVIDLTYGGLSIAARKEDWPAVKEVLVHDEYAFLEDLFATGDRPKVFDVGANIGCFALRVLRAFPEAGIVSVEAAADTADILKANQAGNPRCDWRVISGAVWGTNDPVSLLRTPGDNSAGHRVGGGGSGETVRGLTLEDIFTESGWPDCDLIKMDIEGAEGEVVPSSLDALARTNLLVIELHNDRMDITDVVRALQRVFPCWYRIEGRQSNKPLLLLSKSELPNSRNWAGIAHPDDLWRGPAAA